MQEKYHSIKIGNKFLEGVEQFRYTHANDPNKSKLIS